MMPLRAGRLRHRYAILRPFGQFQASKLQLISHVAHLAALSSILLHQRLNLSSQLASLDLGLCLCIDTHRVLRPRSTHKASPLDVQTDQLVDLLLDALGLDQLPLGIDSLKDSPIGHLDALEVVGEIDVEALPVLHGPHLMCQHHLGKEYVRDCIADSLIDEIDAGREGVESVLCARTLRLGLANGADGVVGEKNGAVAVGFEVDADVVAGGGVVEVLDAGVGALNGQLEHFLDVFSRGTIGVGSLDDAYLELGVDASNAGHVCEEGCTEGGDAVAVEEVEGLGVVGVVVDNAVGVAIEGAEASVRLGGEACRTTLFGLDEVGATLGDDGVSTWQKSRML
jgi:hypothetical protein